MYENCEVVVVVVVDVRIIHGDDMAPYNITTRTKRKIFHRLKIYGDGEVWRLP